MKIASIPHDIKVQFNPYGAKYIARLADECCVECGNLVVLVGLENPTSNPRGTWCEKCCAKNSD